MVVLAQHFRYIDTGNSHGGVVVGIFFGIGSRSDL